MGTHRKINFDDPEFKNDKGYNAWTGKQGYEGLEHNFEVYETVSDDGMRREFSRGRPLTPEGHRILAAEKKAYDDNFGDHSGPEQSDRQPNKGLKRVLFGKWT